jgi:hypothetical protein
MKQSFKKRGVALVLSLVVAGCATNTDDNSTNLRFVNAVAGIDSVDMLVDSDEYLDNVSYLESTAYLEFDTDPHLFQITPSNSLTPIDTQQATLADDVDYTYIACGDSSEGEAILLEDDNEPAGDDSFKARIINVFKGSRGLDVYIVEASGDVDTRQPTADNLGFKATTRYLAARAGVYDIVVRNNKTGVTVARLAGQEFKGENVYSVLLAAEDGSPLQAQVLVLTDHDADS